MEGRSVRSCENRDRRSGGKGGAMKKPSSISGNADREAVWHGGWDMDSRLPGVKPQVWDWGVAQWQRVCLL